MMRGFWAATAVAMGLFAATAPCAADSLADAGRAALAANKDAVITVRIALKQQFAMSGMASHEEESTLEASATIIDASGLAVMSLSQLEPESMFSAMMDREQEDFKMNTKVSEVKYLRPDGGETLAKIVLRDKDFDLAFLRPENKNNEKYAFVDFAKAAKSAELDPIFVVARLEKVANRAYAVIPGRIEAVIEKPRTLYVPTGDVDKVGCPAFAENGAPIGLSVARFIKGGGDPGFVVFGGQPMLLVILPGADVLEAASQAPSYEEAPSEPVEPTEPAPAAPANTNETSKPAEPAKTTE